MAAAESNQEEEVERNAGEDDDGFANFREDTNDASGAHAENGDAAANADDSKESISDESEDEQGKQGA